MQQSEREVSDKSASLYERYASSIFAYVRLFTSSPEDAEDLTLEVFLAALEQDNLSWLKDHQQFVWLRRVAHNKLVDRYRRSMHPAHLSLDQVVETVRSEEHLTPEELIVRREELAQLFQALGELSLTQQQILRLRFGEGLRFAEIAVLLNKREATVRKLCSRTLSVLRTRYFQQEPRKESSHDRPK